MSKAKTLATTVSTGNVLADGTVAYAEVSGTPTLATVATSGSYTDLTDKPTISATATNIAGGSAGTIPYQSALDTTAMLAVGTAGQVLQTNGAGAPTWVTPGGGSWVFITEVTANASSTVDIESSYDSTYDMYAIVGAKLRGSASSRLYITLKVGGSYATNYSYSGTQVLSSPTTSTGRSQSDSNIKTSPLDSLSSNSAFLSSLIMYIPNPSGTVTFKTVSGQLSGMNGNQENSNVNFSGNHTSAGSAGVLTGVRFLASTGTLFGVFRLYGIKNS